jgi:uncharacterized protein YaiI (UPF0178 family)
MTIYLDADALPAVIREILYRAAMRLNIPLVLAANVPIRHPESPLITSLVVPSGFDKADDAIADHASAGDLVITSDIPLAGRVIEKGAVVMDYRGEMLSAENIRERLAVRNILDEIRSAGNETGGPAPFTQKDRQKFANRLDAYLFKRVSGR